MAKHTTEFPKPTMFHWLLLLAIVFIGGSSFAGIKYGLETATPGLVAAGRLWIGAILLTLYARATGRKFPPLISNGKPSKHWLFMLAGGIVGYAIPFTLFPIAQQSVSTMLAGIYMALMPLMTLVMAYFFVGEAMTRRKVLGFVMGAVGVVVLIGPSALSGASSGDLTAQLILIAAILCYSAYGIIAAKAPKMQARSYGAGVIICAALASTIPLFLWGQDWSALSWRSGAGILFLGIFPSGIATIIIIVLIQQVGASFTSLGAYGAPPVAIVLGIILFDEPLKPTFLIGLLIILSGLAISQSKANQLNAMALGIARRFAKK
ncbi:MAG: DMT family transporter [Parvularculaceae bacterium]